MTMFARRFLTLSLSILVFGVASGFLTARFTDEAVESIELAEIHQDLGLFEDRARYDYIDDDFEYSVIGDTEFDEVFYRSALLAARLYQVRETSARYDGGELTLNTQEDTDFLGVMTFEALESLPTLVIEAQDLSTRVTELDPRELGRLQSIRALRGVNRARKNIQTVLESRGEVDAILSDYKVLQADLETVEDESGR